MDKDQIIQLRNHHLKQGRNNDRRPIYPITKAECIIGGAGGVQKVATLPEKGEEGKIYYNTTNKQYYRYHEGSGFSTMGLEDPIPTPFDGIFNIHLVGKHKEKYENGQIVPKTNIDTSKISVGDILGNASDRHTWVTPFPQSSDTYARVQSLQSILTLLTSIPREKESVSIFSQFDGCVYTIAVAYGNDNRLFFYVKDVQPYNGQVYNIEGITYKFVKVPFVMNGVNDLNIYPSENNQGYIWTPKIINTEYHRQIVDSSYVTEVDKGVAKVYLGPVHSKIVEGADIIIFGLSDINDSTYASYVYYEPVYRLVPITGRFTAMSSDLILKYPAGYLRLSDDDISFSESQQYEYNIYDGVISITACSNNDNEIEDSIILAGVEVQTAMSIRTFIAGITPLSEVDVNDITKAMYEAKFGQLGTDESKYRMFKINTDYVIELADYIKNVVSITAIKNIKFSIQISNVLGDMLPIQETEVSPSVLDYLYNTGDIDTTDWPFDIIYPVNLFEVNSRVAIDGLNGDDITQTHHKVHIVIDIDGTSINLGGNSIDRTVHVELNNDTQLINNDYYFGAGNDHTPIDDI